MSDRPRALVVADDPGEFERLCSELTKAGYDAIGFEACSLALDFLDEETPEVAVVRIERRQLDCQQLVTELRTRCVDVVLEGQPVDVGAGC